MLLSLHLGQHAVRDRFALWPLGEQPQLGIERIEFATFGPGDDLQPSVEMLDKGRTALDPIAIVAIEDAAQVADFGMVDVATNDAVEAAFARLVGQRFSARPDILHSVLHLQLQVSRKRPVLIAEHATQYVEIAVDGECSGAGFVAGRAGPFRELPPGVENRAWS